MDGNILIVDDVATNRIVFKVKLGAASYTPLLAATGQECLRLAREKRPDLILLDLALPDLTGVEVLLHSPNAILNYL
jgi:two-component system cell cycle response regulator